MAGALFLILISAALGIYGGYSMTILFLPESEGGVPGTIWDLIYTAIVLTNAAMFFIGGFIVEGLAKITKTIKDTK